MNQPSRWTDRSICSVGDPIAQHGKQTSLVGRAAGLLKRAEQEVDRIRTAALERALREEAVELAKEEAGKVERRRLSRRVRYLGSWLQLRVPQVTMPDGSVRLPELFGALEMASERVIELLEEVGVSTRNVSKVVRAFFGDTAGTSSSNVSRMVKGAGNENLQRIMERRLDGEQIVAVAVDGTWIGVTGDKRTVMIATGITADGRKLALAVGIAQYERYDDVHPFLEGLVRRGLDPGVLWIVDQGGGIRSSINSICRDKPPRIQVCTTHVARNATAKLPEEKAKEVRRRLYAACAATGAEVERTDPEALANAGADPAARAEAAAEIAAQMAEAKLRELANELEAEGYKAQASSLQNGLSETMTTIRLGLEGETRFQMRSTNLAESINSAVKNTLKDVSLWRDDEMRLRWVAHRLAALEASKWRRVADPQALVEVMEKLTPGQHDAEAILMRLPPNVAASKLPVAFDEPEQLAKFAAEWCAAAPGAVWDGAPGALAALGLKPGDPTLPRELTEALQARDVGSGTVMRRPGLISVQRRDETGAPAEVKTPGLLCLQWELAASPAAMAQWNDGGTGSRATIEAAMLEAGSAAAARLTSTTQPGHGFAGTVALLRPEARGPEREPALRVTGIAVAVSRGKAAKLGSPAARAALEAATARDAEDAAREVLDAALREVKAPTPQRTPRPPAPPSAALLAGVEARALEKAAPMTQLEPRELEAKAADTAEARAGLEQIGAEVEAWKAAHWRGATWQLAALRVRLAHGDPSRDREGTREIDPRRLLRRGDRLVLGEETAQHLLGTAALAQGLAEGDPEQAGNLSKDDRDHLADLRPAVARVERMAEALAAGRELERRRVLETALGGVDPGRTADPVAAADRSGRRIVDPVERFGRFLGQGRAELLRRWAAGFAPKLRDLDDSTLQQVSAALGDPWSGLDQNLSRKIGCLERDRDVALAERLGALRQVGESSGVARVAERGKNGGAFVEADERAEVAKKTAAGHLQRLHEVEGQLAKHTDRQRSPGEFLRSGAPRAVLEQAVQAELLRPQRVTARERGEAVATPGVEPQQIEPPALEAPPQAPIEIGA